MPAYRYQTGDSPLDGYTIQHALGRGGFGEVYFAISDAGREVALKAVQNYEDIELRGIGHCMNLKSQHLVMIFDVKKDHEGTAWVIMEYVAGANLREILDEAPSGLGTEQATYFLRELCSGLSYLHDAGVVHRDLKPNNIFFEDGVVKIGDYSLSKAITTSHRSGHTTTVGSVHYMAPEISRGQYDKTVDIYALGVILFEMLTGAPPFEGDSMGEVLMKHLSSDPDVSGLPAPFDRIVAKAMNRDPDQRYQSASEMKRDLTPGNTLDHSRPPATLSMIGERAVQQRADSKPSEAALAETFVTPVALRDTHQDESLPFERPSGSDLSSVGLWWRPNQTGPLAKDSTSIGVRLLIAAAACLMLVPLGCMGDLKPWFWGDVFTLSLVCAAGSSIACWGYLAAMPHGSGLLNAILTRGIAVAPFIVIGILFDSMPPHMELNPYISIVVGLMTAHAIMDYRCLLSADRYPRISMTKTGMAGGITMIATALYDEGEDHILFGIAIACASSIVIQLVAPHRRPINSTGQAVNPSDTVDQRSPNLLVKNQPASPAFAKS